MTEFTREERRQIHITLRSHEMMDNTWQQILKLSQDMAADNSIETTEVACAAGCAACCSYLVDTLSTEAFVIAASIEQSEDAYRLPVLTRLLDWEWEFYRWLRTHPMPPKNLEDPSDVSHDLWRGAWQTRRIACPFLDMDNYRCSIYEDRPATCRGHHACYPPPSEMGPDVILPPEGCFTKVEDLASGHLTPIWQLNSELCEVFAGMLGDNLKRNNIEIHGSLLPLIVLQIGRKRFGWPPPNPNKRRPKPPRITQARKDPDAPQMDRLHGSH